MIYFITFPPPTRRAQETLVEGCGMKGAAPWQGVSSLRSHTQTQLSTPGYVTQRSCPNSSKDLNSQKKGQLFSKHVLSAHCVSGARLGVGNLAETDAPVLSP